MDSGVRLKGRHPRARRKTEVFLAFTFAWVLAAVAAASGIWGLTNLLSTKHESVPGKVVQFDISQPPGSIYSPPISRQPLAISPDGTRLAFHSDWRWRDTHLDARPGRVGHATRARHRRRIVRSSGRWTANPYSLR